MQRKAFLFLLLVTMMVSVVRAAPADFTLSTPADGSLIKSPASLTSLVWTASVDATTYNFYLMRISDNVRIAELVNETGLTPTPDGDQMGCGPTACTYVVNSSLQAMLTNGQYVWNVEAVNATGTVEATNAPYFFTVNTNPVELLTNGGFETRNSANEPDQTPWVGVSQTKSKVMCNDGVKVYANTGTCGLQLVALGGLLTQVVDSSWILPGDLLTLEAAINTNVAPAGTIVSVKVVYFDPLAGASNNGKDKIIINLSSTTSGFDDFTSSTLTVDAVVKKTKVKVGYAGSVGKVLVDDVSLVVAPAP